MPYFVNLIGDRGGGKTAWGVFDQCQVHQQYPSFPMVTNVAPKAPFDDGVMPIYVNDILKWLAIKTILAAGNFHSKADPNRIAAGRLYANVNLDEAAIQGLESRGSASHASVPNTYLLALSRKVRVDLKLFTQLMCLPKGTLIQTPKGGVPIEEIKKDDSVIDNTYWGKRLKKVISTSKSIQSELLEITLEDGHRIRATPNHRFPVHVRGQIKKDIFTKDLVAGQMLKIDQWQEQERELDPMSVLLGVIHAEGSFRISLGMKEINQLDLTMDKREKELVDFVVNTIHFFRPQAHIGTHESNKNNTLHIVLSAKSDVQFFYLSYRRFLKETQDSKLMKSFLAGFFEGDGCASGYEISLCQSATNFEKLQIAMDYLTELGIPFHLYSSWQKPKGAANTKYAKHEQYEVYRLVVATAYGGIFANSIGFVSSTKNQKAKRVTKNLYARIVNITHKYGEFEVYDIQVKGAPYFMANGIRSHNSMIDKRGQWISDYDILCEASKNQYFIDGTAYPVRFNYTIYKNLRPINHKHIDGEFMRQNVYPKYDTDDVPLTQTMIEDFIEFYEIKANDYTEYRRVMDVLA